ncbi:MAG TPA: ATP-binding cassette domain-containing protein [Burkholderiales bacterium]|nr:ATP-binding cassette domain-containing protein [Burkholderiales bacterium]
MSGTAYSLDAVRYAYPDAPSGFSLELDALRIRPGDALALVGPNGSGKTTLLMLLAFLLRPDRGRLGFFGDDPWTDEARTLLARREAVLVTHHPYLFKGTVLDNVEFGLKVRGLPEAERRDRVQQALALVELSGWESRPVAGLSAGQAQRVALARAMALHPRALLLDEPTANVEAGLALRVEAAVREVGRETGATVVFSSHDYSQASRLADAILHLSEGRQVRFSHENCFSGTAATDGTRSWIEPRAGVRIVFPGTVSGHVTCVIDPSAITLEPAGGGESAAGPNAFRGRVIRLETTEADLALVRASGDLVFRVTLPLREVEARGIALSRSVLLKFKPEAVEAIGSKPTGKTA